MGMCVCVYVCMCVCVCIYIYVCVCVYIYMGFPGGSDDKESTCNAGDLDLIPGLGRSPGGGHSNPIQSSCLENPHRWSLGSQRVRQD